MADNKRRYRVLVPYLKWGGGHLAQMAMQGEVRDDLPLPFIADLVRDGWIELVEDKPEPEAKGGEKE